MIVLCRSVLGQHGGQPGSEWQRSIQRKRRVSELYVMFCGPDAEIQDSLHQGADRTSGEGVLQGELRVKAQEV